jgi:hypothetical protein
MLRYGLAGVVLALSGAGCVARSSNAIPPAVTGAERSEDALALNAEVVVARDILRGYRQYGVVVDSIFAVAEQAPGSPSADVRPHIRAEALRTLLGSNSDSRAPNTVILHLSKPRITDGVARITATVVFPDNRSPGRRGYETVDYTLHADGGSWAVRTRVQLGIT